MSGKTIKAWAVVCARGAIHRAEVNEADAKMWVAIWDEVQTPTMQHFGSGAWCGPHRLVLLTGEVEK